MPRRKSALSRFQQDPDLQDDPGPLNRAAPPEAPAGRWPALGVAAVVVLLSLSLLAWQAWWERRSSLIIPDHHYVLRLTHAAAAHHWIQVRLGLEDPQELAQRFPGMLRRGFLGSFPNTDDYPPLTFLLAGGAMTLLGKTLAIARMSQWFLVAGFLACMARIGWQLAGPRGALLLAIGAATSPWLSYHLFNFSMIPALVLTLALTMTLILDSRGLTRRRACLALGVVLGLGMLVNYSFLLFSAPLVATAAFWGRRFAPGAWKGGVAVVVTFLLLAALILEIQAQYQPGYNADWDELSRIGFWCAESLFLLLALIAWRLGRRGWNSGAGLALAIAVAGLMCAPWYLAHLKLMFNLVELQWSSSPVCQESLWGWHFVFSKLVFLNTFYTLGLSLVLFALILPGNLRRWGPGYPVIVAGLLGSVALCWTLLVPNVRYLAPLLPLMTTAAFLWAARWKWTFIGCLAFQLLMGALELPWFPPNLPWFPVRAGLEEPDNRPTARTPFDLVIWRPVDSSLEMEASDPLRVLPPGVRVSVKMPGMTRKSPGEFKRLRIFFEYYLWGRNPVPRWSDEKLQDLDRVDYVLALIGDPEVAENPRLAIVPESDAVIYVGNETLKFRLFRVVPERSRETPRPPGQGPGRTEDAIPGRDPAISPG